MYRSGVCDRTNDGVEYVLVFFFSSRRRHTRFDCDWSSDVCSSDLGLPTGWLQPERRRLQLRPRARWRAAVRSEEHTSELQSQSNLVCRLLLEKKKKILRNYLTCCMNY